MTNEQLATYVSSSWVLGINIGFTLVASVVSHWHSPLALSLKPADLVDAISILFNATYLVLVFIYLFSDGEAQQNAKYRNQQRKKIEKQRAYIASLQPGEGNGKGDQNF